MINQQHGEPLSLDILEKTRASPSGFMTETKIIQNFIMILLTL